MKPANEAIVKIIEGMVEQLLALSSDLEGKNNTIKEVKSLFQKISVGAGVFLAKQVVDKLGGNAEFVDGLFNNQEQGAEISQLKRIIAREIEQLLKKSNDAKKGCIFFIDDLDRIDPPVAVQILELLKNIFDLNKCIFILAIDYDVVIKGLEPKFGKLTDKNEREFRSFFDKIIQLPFSMPVANYDIEQFLIDALQRIGYISDEEMHDKKFIHSLTEFANLSVGTNPRALKRLVNTLSLINIINKEKHEHENQGMHLKQLSFAMVCMQIAYPTIYNKLLEAPDFVNWNEATAIKFALDSSESDLLRLQLTDEFNDEWEKVLYRMCQKETHTSNRVFHISRLLNSVHQLIQESESVSSMIESALEVSAVTNLKAYDNQVVIKVSRKNSVDWMINFTEKLHHRLCESGINSQNLALSSEKTRWTELIRIPIIISTKRFSSYQFSMDFTQITWEGLVLKFRVWEGQNCSIAKHENFDTLVRFMTNKNLPKRRLTDNLAMKNYPLNFSKLTSDMLTMLENSNELDRFITAIISDVKLYMKNFADAIEADR